MRIIFTIAMTFWVYNAKAQLNESDTLKYQLRANLTGNYQVGNVQLLILRSKLDFSTRINNFFVYKSQNSSLYQEISKHTVDKDFYSRNYLYYQPSKKIYPFVIAYFSSNYRRKIAYRYFAGMGTSFQLINTKKNVLKLSGSMVYENTNFLSSTYNDSFYNGSLNINLWRGTLYAGGWSYLSSKQIRLFYEAYYQAAFVRNSNYRSQIDMGIDIYVWKGLTFNAYYYSTRENLTPLNVKQNDKILTFGLAYTFQKK